MCRLSSLTLTGCLLIFVACNDGDTTIVGFSQFADAQAAREQLIAAGAEVSDRLTFVDGQWTFESSLPYESVAQVTGECSSSGSAPLGPGKTVCDFRADAETERSSMVSDGWDCTEIVQAQTGTRWEFEWVKVAQG